MKAFADLTDDERAEWRSSPVTQAFLAWMKAEGDDAKKAALAAVQAGTLTSVSYHLATMYVGKVGAFEKAVDTATRSFDE